jgi:hypothetical protein
MEHLRLASPSDDLYSGYNEYPSAFSTKDLDQDEIFQQALRTSYGRRPVVSYRIVITTTELYLLYRVMTGQ